MPVRLDWNLPVVVVCNISETFFDFLSRAEDDQTSTRLIHGEQFRGDRSLVWLGDPKLVIVTFPIPHAEDLCRSLGYHGTRHLAPASPSPWLSLDILREHGLLEAIVEYAGPGRTIQLIPYATTPQFHQLVQALRSRHHLNVILPESPAPEAMWLRDYIDTKAGFRVLASRWLPDPGRLPLGMVCYDLHQAAEIALWFGATGRSCVLKADIGENGIGNYILAPGRFSSAEAIEAELQHNTFLRADAITVEEFIPSAGQLSPSLELYVPPPAQGGPEITYLSRQLFLEFGDFCGVLVSRELQEAPWYAALAEQGLLIAGQLQALGYVGHFDLDAVVDDQQRAFLLEINSRRTGGTHVHEFAQFAYGPDYLQRLALLSNDAIPCPAIADYAQLRAAVGDLLYPMPDGPRGVIITGTSALAAHEFGAILVGASVAEVSELQRRLTERVQTVASAAVNSPVRDLVA